jgi:DNA-binding transcriptional LysR family regulator
MSTAVALVTAGLGVAILPSTAVEVRSPGVVARPLDDPAFSRRLSLVRRRAGSMRRIVDAFIERLLEHTQDSRELVAAS